MYCLTRKEKLKMVIIVTLENGFLNRTHFVEEILMDEYFKKFFSIISEQMHLGTNVMDIKGKAKAFIPKKDPTISNGKRYQNFAELISNLQVSINNSDLEKRIFIDQINDELMNCSDFSRFVEKNFEKSRICIAFADKNSNNKKVKEIFGNKNYLFIEINQQNKGYAINLIKNLVSNDYKYNNLQVDKQINFNLKVGKIFSRSSLYWDTVVAIKRQLFFT